MCCPLALRFVSKKGVCSVMSTRSGSELCPAHLALPQLFLRLQTLCRVIQPCIQAVYCTDLGWAHLVHCNSGPPGRPAGLYSVFICVCRWECWDRGMSSRPCESQTGMGHSLVPSLYLNTYPFYSAVTCSLIA